MAQQQQNTTRTQNQFENPLFREIHKNTWLKKISPANSKKVKRNNTKNLIVN